PQPIDAMMVEVANDVIGSAGGAPMSVVSNYYFSVVSLLLMCLVATVVTERIIEPRLGAFVPSEGDSADAGADEEMSPEAAAAEAKGLRYALFGFLGILALVLLATVPPGAPLRDPASGAIIGNTPFMDSLLFIIVLFFLVAGVCYGVGAGTVKSANDV